MENKILNFLLIGLEAEAEKFITPLIASHKIYLITKSEDFESMLDNPIEPPPCIVFVGKSIEKPSASECAQFLKMQFAESALYYVSQKLPDYNRKELLKNGYTDVFSLEIDQNILTDVIKQSIAKQSEKVKSYRRVQLVDIEENMVLDFDTLVYLPANNKYLSFTRPGEPLTIHKMSKLKKHGYTTVHIPHQQSKLFYKYTTDRLKSVSQDKSISSTERQERMKNMVRGLLSDLVAESSSGESIATGRKLAGECHKIVTQYILSTPSGGWYKKLILASNEDADIYSHSTNVATYGTLFSLATGKGNPEYVAFAGILHDLGMTRIPQEIREKDYSTLKSKEKETYQSHIAHTIDLIKARKLLLPDTVKTAILQHHEAFNGSGYPKGVSGHAISPEARILAISDYFDELTIIRPNKPKKTIKEAIDALSLQLDLSEKACIFDPVILEMIVDLFKFPEDETTDTKKE